MQFCKLHGNLKEEMVSNKKKFSVKKKVSSIRNSSLELEIRCFQKDQKTGIEVKIEGIS